MAFTPIDQVVRQNCRETGDLGYKNYDTILGHVRGALVDLQLYVMPNVSKAYVTLNTLKNFLWPLDCIQVLKVHLERNGKRCLLSVSTNEPVFDCGCSSESDIVQAVSKYCCGESDYNFGFDSSNICVHDKDKRTTHIKFTPQKGDKIRITYSSDGISNGVTQIPVEAEKPISEWVMWKYYRRTDKGLSDRAQINYEKFSYQLRTLYQDRSLEEWLEALLKD